MYLKANHCNPITGSMDDEGNTVQGGALYWKSPAAGASTHIFGAFDKEIANDNGVFLQ